MTHSPGATGVTTPLLFTRATSSSEETHTTVLLSAFLGSTVARRVPFLPTLRSSWASFRRISSGCCFTTMRTRSLLPEPSAAVPVTVTVPRPSPVTTPNSSTVAIFSLLTDHFTA